MSPMLPPVLLPIAGLLALVIVWPRLHEQPSNSRLFLKALGVGLSTIALIWAAWVLLWWIEQRW
jgi:hypothetical protein